MLTTLTLIFFLFWDIFFINILNIQILLNISIYSCSIPKDFTTKQCLDISCHFEASLSLTIDSLYSVQLPRQTHPHSQECYHRGSWPGHILRCHSARSCVHTSFLALCTPLPPPEAKLNLCSSQILFKKILVVQSAS